METESSIIPLQPITNAITKKYGIHLFMLRLDLNHPHISGNKLLKLKYNVEEAKKQRKKTILTFGGAFSNHIAATAAAGKEHGFKTIGIIRGDELKETNTTLKSARENGMLLHYVSRESYRDKSALYKYVHEKFTNEDFYLIPEGGSNKLGVLGCTEIVKNISIDFNYICSPCGTGATLSGIIMSLKKDQQAIGFQILKNENYIKNEVENWLNQFEFKEKINWQINEDHHFGAYAKINAELIEFVERLKEENNIPLDYVYTGKMMFGIYKLIENGFFKRGEVIIAVHTGGLQGNSGFEH